MDAAEVARQRAEARRQKILARQKDRLTAITGVYSQSERQDEAPSSSTGAAAATSSSGGGAAPALREWESEAGTASAGAGPSAAAALAAARQQEQRELETLMAQLQSSLAQAAAAAGGPPPPLHAPGGAWAGPGAGVGLGHSPADADAANAAMQTLLAGMAEAAAAAETAAAAPGGDAAAGGAAVQRRGVWDALQRDTPGVILWFGRVLGVIMQETQLVRLLAAAAVAYAAVAGLLQQPGGSGSRFVGAPPLRPALVLLGTQLSIIGAGVLLLGRRAARRVAERDGQYGVGGGGVQLPMRLRQLDVLSYLPGAREALAGLSGYRQLADGLSGDAAVYLLVCGLLSLTARAPADAE